MTDVPRETNVVPMQRVCEACLNEVRVLYPLDVPDEATEEMKKLNVCGFCVRELQERREREGRASELLNGLDGTVSRLLLRAGLGQREVLEARVETMPEEVASVLESQLNPIVADMREGAVPASGFGLAGVNGCGKSFAVAAMLREMLLARYRREIPKRGEAALSQPSIRWVRWPEHAMKMRALSTNDGGVREAEIAVREMAMIDVLVLDDLGVERMKGAYADDWVASMMDVLVDARYNAVKPTWYTTNLKATELAQRYGGRLVSRLCGENPLVWINDGRDLRL